MNAEIPCHCSTFLCLGSRACGLSLDQRSSCLQARSVPRLALAWHAPLRVGRSGHAPLETDAEGGGGLG
jgi:hypothetical protein